MKYLYSILMNADKPCEVCKFKKLIQMLHELDEDDLNILFKTIEQMYQEIISERNKNNTINT